MLILRKACTLLLLLLTVTGCQHIGISHSDSLFVSRYTHYIRGNIPNQYADLANPLPTSTENISAGKRLYQTHCQACHGVSGKGDGPACKSLAPRPANLAFTRRLPIATDAFLFWTVSEGGTHFDTAMPAFEEQLSAKEIWQIIHYINADFTLDQG